MDEVEKLNELVWAVVAAIPQGCVRTYGDVASLIGFPSHARYVGSVLKKLPKGTALPWHRVVNAKGEISFPEGSDGYLRQKCLLEKEGIVFVGKKLSLKTYRAD